MMTDKACEIKDDFDTPTPERAVCRLWKKVDNYG